MRRVISIVFLVATFAFNAAAMGERYDDRKTIVNEQPLKKDDLDVKAGRKGEDDGR